MTASPSPFDWPDTSKGAVDALRTQNEELLKKIDGLEAQNTMQGEFLLHKVSDWLHSVGKDSVADRIDPRKNDYDSIMKMLMKVEL